MVQHLSKLKYNFFPVEIWKKLAAYLDACSQKIVRKDMQVFFIFSEWL